MAATALDHLRKTTSVGSVSLKSPAKINISLVVRHKRPDDYHDLLTVMAAVNLADDLLIQQTHTPGIQLECSGIPCPTGPDNLVVRAANVLAAHAGIEPVLKIHLHKRIPLAAGLAGGSSNAASCLIGLNTLWNLGLSVNELSRIAGELGSDIPFFFHTPVALCSGRGDVAEPLSLRCEKPIILILSDIEILTAKVYQHYRHDPVQSEQLLDQVRSCLDAGDLDGLLSKGINNLASVSFDLYESLRTLKDKIGSVTGLPVHLTGSGSALFAPCSDISNAKYWAEKINQMNLAHALVLNFDTQSHPSQEVQHGDF